MAAKEGHTYFLMTQTQQQVNKINSAWNLHSALLLITTIGPSFQMGTKINYKIFWS